MTNKFDIKELYGKMKSVCAGVSSSIFTSDRPDSTATPMDDFIVVALPSKINDRYAYGVTTCRFTLFARDISGVENYTRLSELQRALLLALPFDDGECRITEPTPLPGGSDGVGFHTLHILCKFTIF